MWTKADYKLFRGEDRGEDFLTSAGELYDKMAENWDDTCGGGGELPLSAVLNVNAY